MKFNPKLFACKVYPANESVRPIETNEPADVGKMIKSVADPLVSGEEGMCRMVPTQIRTISYFQWCGADWHRFQRSKRNRRIIEP
jgi:hypothetical protein